MSFTISAALVGEYEVPESIKEYLLDATAGSDSFLLAELASKIDFLEFTLMAGATIDLLGNYDPESFPEDGTVWQQLVWAMLNTPTTNDPLPHATADEFFAVSLGAGFGVGDIGGLEVELGLSTGTYEALEGFSASIEGDIGSKSLYYPDGIGISIPIGKEIGSDGFFMEIKDIIASDGEHFVAINIAYEAANMLEPYEKVAA